MNETAANLSELIAELKTKTPTSLDDFHNSDDGFYHVEIRERKIGWGDLGRRVYRCSWEERYIEHLDEFQWEFSE